MQTGKNEGEMYLDQMLDEIEAITDPNEAAKRIEAERQNIIRAAQEAAVEDAIDTVSTVFGQFTTKGRDDITSAILTQTVIAYAGVQQTVRLATLIEQMTKHLDKMTRVFDRQNHLFANADADNTHLNEIARGEHDPN